MGLENSTDEASIGLIDLSLSGKVGLRSIVCYVSTTVLAVILGIILVTSIQPGAGGLDEDEVQAVGEKRNITTADTLMDLLTNCFPPRRENMIDSSTKKLSYLS